jgi:hypothetical protein
MIDLFINLSLLQEGMEFSLKFQLTSLSINLAPFIPWNKEATTLQLENLKPHVDEIPGAKDLKEEVNFIRISLNFPSHQLQN